MLPLNIINEKIYVFLWFWFVTLAFITAFQVEKGIFLTLLKFWRQVTYRLSTCLLPNLRTMLLRARAKLNKNPRQVDAICRKFRLGDWFVLYQLGKNIDPLIFREFINDLYEKLNSLDAEKNDGKLY